MSRIVKSSRCLMAGRCVLMGFDQDGREVYGLGARPKNMIAWARAGNKADLKRLQASYAAYLAEVAAEGGDR